MASPRKLLCGIKVSVSSASVATIGVWDLNSDGTVTTPKVWSQMVTRPGATKLAALAPFKSVLKPKPLFCKLTP